MLRARLSAAPMGRAAQAASRTMRGGRGPRRTADAHTPSGRARSAHRWTAEAALAASKQQHLLLALKVAPSLFKVMELVLAPGGGVEAFLAGAVMRAAPTRVRALTCCILLDHKDKVRPDLSNLTYQAKQVCERLRAHAGPPGRVEEIPQPGGVVPRPAGWWLDGPQQPLKTPRPQPPLGGRMLPELDRWRLDRLEHLPDHAVLCFERALGRVDEWRKRTRAGATAAPPLALLQALIFIDQYPTAIASEADHFWMVALGRWATVTEMMRLFGVPERSHAWHALVRSKFTARQLVATLGRAVQVDAAAQAFGVALASLAVPPAGPPITYASACSGIDLMAVAFGKALGAPFVHVGASELDGDLAEALAGIHAHSGLTTADVTHDARDAGLAEAARPADVWSITPPCEAFSRRNHSRSEGGALEAASEIDLMLHYPRVHRPRAIVVENVDEPESRSVVSASLLSLPGYAWRTFASEAAALGQMARARRFWVGIRV